MNVKSTLIASALVSTLVAAGCGTETSSPSAIGGYVPQQSAANYEEGLVLAARGGAAEVRPSGSGGTHTQARPQCRMSSDAVEQWLTDGVVPRCHLLAHRQYGNHDHRR
jgi:hypothetical protein